MSKKYVKIVHGYLSYYILEEYIESCRDLLSRSVYEGRIKNTITSIRLKDYADFVIDYQSNKFIKCYCNVTDLLERSIEFDTTVSLNEFLEVSNEEV